jgi:hypothetical protein
MGGTDNPNNLIELSVKDHAQAHYDLWKKHNCIEDKIAWLCLSGRKLSEKDRIELSISGFKKFLLNEEKVQEWKKKISTSQKGKTHSKETKLKLSISLKLAYKEGRKKNFVDKDAARKRYYDNNMAQILTDSRKKSEKWRLSVTSEEIKAKKTLADPRSKKVTVNGMIYNSIREASKKTNINYSKLRNILLSNINDNIFFC